MGIFTLLLLPHNDSFCFKESELFMQELKYNFLTCSTSCIMVKKSNKDIRDRSRADANTPSLIGTILQNTKAVIFFVCCLGGVVSVFCIYSAGLFGAGAKEGGTKFLINADDKELKDAFFSDDSPHLFYCHEHGNRVSIL
jgi:hypothetical protein